MRHILAMTLAVLLSAGAAGAQDWNAGVEAHERGDFKRALAIWNIAARNGDLRAHYSIAMLYATGKGVPENEVLAHGWWHDAATLGHAASQIAVGRNYLHGDGVSKDRKLALYWMRQAATQGDPYGQFVLAQTYSGDDAFSAYVWGNIGCANGYAAACVIRNGVETMLSETELRSAQDAATTCFNSGYKSCD